MKIRPVGAELFHAHGQTDERTDGRIDMTKITAADSVEIPTRCGFVIEFIISQVY